MPVQTITQTASAVSTRTKIIATAVAVAALGGIAAGLTPLYTNKPDLQVRSIEYTSQPGTPGVAGSAGIFIATTIVNAGGADITGSKSSNVSSPVNVVGKDFYLGFDFFDGANKQVSVSPNEIFFSPALNPDFSLSSSPTRQIRFLVKNGLKARSMKKIVFSMTPSPVNSKGITSIVASADPTNAVNEGPANSIGEKNNNFLSVIPVQYRIFAPDYQATDLQINQSSTGYTFSLKYKNIGLTYGQGWIGLSAKDANGAVVAINSDMIKFDGRTAASDYTQSTQFTAVRMPDTFTTDEITLTGTIKTALKTAGAVSITAKADITNVVPEINEANNERSLNLPVIVQKSDLTVNPPTFTILKTGTGTTATVDEVRLAVTYNNIGTATQSWPITLGFVAKKADGTEIPLTSGDLLTIVGSVSQPMTQPNYVQLGAVSATPFGIGASARYNGTITKQLLNKGIAELHVKIDFTDSISELIDDNNTAFAALPASVIITPNTPTTPAADIVPPTIISTSPADNATDVATGYNITAIFSEPLDLNTVLGTNIYLAKTAAPTTHIGGTVTFDTSSKTLFFHPNQIIAGGTNYTFTITTAVKDVAGNSLASNKTWTFTTASPAGSLSITASNNTPNSGTLVAGTTGNVMTIVKFSATGESFIVDKLTVTNDPSLNDDNLYQSVTIKYPDNSGAIQTANGAFVNGSASFAGLTFFVAKDLSATISLIGNLNSIAGGAVANQTTLLGINGDAIFSARGWSSNIAIDQSTPGIDTVNGNTFTISNPTQGTLNFSLNASSPTGLKIPASNTEIIRFNATVSTNTAVSPDISDITIALNSVDMSNDDWICNKNSTISIYELSDPTTNLAGAALGGTGCAVNMDTTTYLIPLARGISIAPGTTKTFVIKMDTTSARQNDSLVTTVKNVGFGYSGSAVGPLVTGTPVVSKDAITF